MAEGVTFASEPFDRLDREVILVSSDNIHFGCHRTILSIVSPFFSDMFSLPQAPHAGVPAGNDSAYGQQEVGGIPVIPVTESSKTLDTLLRFIYPVPRPKLAR